MFSALTAGLVKSNRKIVLQNRRSGIGGISRCCYRIFSTENKENIKNDDELIDFLPQSTKGGKPAKLRPLLSSLLKFSDIKEFPGAAKGCYQWAALKRITGMALQKVIFEPPTLHLLGASIGATLCVACLEGSLMVRHEILGTMDSFVFVTRFSLEQLFPSVVLETQDPKLVATALGMDPNVVLRDLTGISAESANLLLRTHLLKASRYFFAGFMVIAQVLRAGTISWQCVAEYEERIRLGREPPLNLEGGLVVRLCGKDSHVSEVSLSKMDRHLFPVYEEPKRVQFLVWKYSEQNRRPVYWSISPSNYASGYSWDRFPVSEKCLIGGAKKDDKLLILEADATNVNDPLSLGDAALDLTLSDASQGFSRILERYDRIANLRVGRDFRTLRVYLGNSMVTYSTGGGHFYTLRHRLRYAREMDVLIDSRAPVLDAILEWCHEVASVDGKIFFQTSSPAYFLNLQSLLREYGYELYDPLDLRVLSKLRDEQQERFSSSVSARETLFADLKTNPSLVDDIDLFSDHAAFLQNYLNDEKSSNAKVVDESCRKSDMLRKVAKLTNLPRLVHMETSPETVNAVESMIRAGIVVESNCCVLIDREEGVSSLETSLKRQPDYVKEQPNQWTTRKQSEEGSLKIICSSSILDESLRQVRTWARMGYSASEIQGEIDAQFQDLLSKSHSVQRQVQEQTKVIANKRQTEGGEVSNETDSAEEETDPAK